MFLELVFMYLEGSIGVSMEPFGEWGMGKVYQASWQTAWAALPMPQHMFPRTSCSYVPYVLTPVLKMMRLPWL